MFQATALHGDRCQEDRDRAIREFKVNLLLKFDFCSDFEIFVQNDFQNGTHRILIATSVAARGLDVKDISTVVNYDMPNEIDEYIHRIGRTARIGHKGRAITFLEDGRDRRHVPSLINILKDADVSEIF